MTDPTVGRRATAPARSWTAVDLLEVFHEVERSEHLMEFELCGELVWQDFRARVFYDLVDRVVHGGASRSTGSRSVRMRQASRILRGLPRSLPRHARWRAREADVLVVNHPRRVMIDGRYHCLYTDELLGAADFSYQVLEPTVAGAHLAPAPTENLLYYDLAELLARARAVARMALGEIPVGPRARLDSADRALVRVTGEPGHRESLSHALWRGALLQASLRGFVEQLLDTVAPKLLIEVVGYAPLLQLMNRLARQRGIVVAELQHGAIGPGHPGYSYPADVPTPSAPDYLLTFGRFWHRNIRMGLAEDRHVPVGFPYLERQSATVPQLDASARRDVLIISQHTVGPALAELAAELDRRLTHRGYRVVLKLHPSEGAGWESRYPNLASSGVHVAADSTRSLYDFFGTACCQIGVYSTAVYEGMYFDLPTFVYKLDGWEVFSGLVDDGLVRAVSSPEEIETALEEPPPASARAELWEPGGVANIQNFIRKQLAGGTGPVVDNTGAPDR